MIDFAAVVRTDARAVQVVGATPEELYNVIVVENLRGHICRVVRGRRSETIKEFFNEVASAFQFPPYFGQNKGAYEDLMRDLSWLDPQNGVVVGVTDADQLMCRDDFEELMWLVEVSFRLAHEWQADDESSSVYRVLLQSENPAELTAMMDAWVTHSLPTLAL